MWTYKNDIYSLLLTCDSFVNESRKELKWHELLIIGRDRYYIHPFSFFKSSFSLPVEILFRDNRAPWCNNRRVYNIELKSERNDEKLYAYTPRSLVIMWDDRAFVNLAALFGVPTFDCCPKTEFNISHRLISMAMKGNNEEERMKRDYLSYPFRY